MIKWRRLISVIVIVVLFLILTVVAAVEYSSPEAKNKANKNILYRRVAEIIESGQEFFKTWPVKTVTEEGPEEDISKTKWDNKLKEYIEISREKEGLIIIMRNSQGEFFKRIWPIFNKK